ncbi:MAG: AAA family ATPase [Saprospiraceae bacterium]|nr:AAA family ATPase [Saprospiraceae bacterium]
MSHPNKAIENLMHITKLLKLEWDEDFADFKSKILDLPLSQRQKLGYTWYPVNIVNRGYSVGDRAYIDIEKKSDEVNDQRQFKSGNSVNVFSNQAGVSNPNVAGIVHFVDKRKMRIILNAQDHPDWISMGHIGVDLLFDDRTYQEMEKALNQVIKANDNTPLATLRDIAYGLKPSSSKRIVPIEQLERLNESQKNAIQNIVHNEDIAIIHGPPGTGKTTTLIETIAYISTIESNVLVTAPSNAAVDLLTELLANKGLNVVRIGNVSRVDASVISHTLDVLISKHPESKNIKKVKIEAAELRKQASRYKRVFDHSAYEERKQLYKQAAELSQWANHLEDKLIDEILFNANVITCTLVGAAHPLLNRLKFNTVVIDEAAQALEPACWIAMAKAKKVIMAGDPFQLPPTVKSYQAQREGLSTTLLERCLTTLPESNLLNIQYRMNKLIMGFSNDYFYQNKLVAHESVAERRLDFDINSPIQFIDTAGCGFDEKSNALWQSKSNPDEYHIIREHLISMIENSDIAQEALPRIAIISPYSDQVNFIKEEIKSEPLFAHLDIDVNSIDGFQGQEREIIYISLVRSNDKQDIGFLNDYRRMNVAMTRAMKKLVIIGDSATIGLNKFYSKFLDYCERHQSYHTAWEYLYKS